MPNWTDNCVTITGDLEILKKILDTGFDFQQLHPCPFIEGETSHEGWYDWCCDHWGTKWTARDISMELDENNIRVYFRTAWAAPHGLLAFLTNTYSNIEIINEWNDENTECVGQTRYKHGIIYTQSIDPCLFTKEALQKFELTSPWFCFENVEPYIDDLDQEKLLSKVEVKYWEYSYERFVRASQQSRV